MTAVVGVPLDLRAEGISYRQLNYWISSGLLHPVDRNPGSGIDRLWSTSEAEVAVRMARLVRAGLRPPAAAGAARHGAEVWLTDTVKIAVLS